MATTTRQQQLQLQLAGVTMKTKSTRQGGEQRDSEGATRYAPKKKTFIHVLTTTPETNRTTTRDEEGHTPSCRICHFDTARGVCHPSSHLDTMRRVCPPSSHLDMTRRGIPSSSCCCHLDTTGRHTPLHVMLSLPFRYDEKSAPLLVVS